MINLDNVTASMLLASACQQNDLKDFMGSLHYIIESDKNCHEVMPSFISESAMVLFTSLNRDDILPAGRRFALLMNKWGDINAPTWYDIFEDYADSVKLLGADSKAKGIAVNDNPEGALICLNKLLDLIEGKLKLRVN
jgi:hypothetical protein